jgi:AcrR family transcriptional regulator
MRYSKRMSSAGQARRRYNADGRRAQARATRERILATARALFLEQGYAATSIAQIAAAAGVSTPTVFAGFSSKVNLLKEATETLLVGDGDPVPLADRPQMRHVHAGATAAEVLHRLAGLIAEAAPRVCPMFAVVQAAADTDPEIARLARTLDEQRLTGAAQLTATVAARLGEADPQRLAEIRDTIWTLNSPQLYGLLVVQRGWSARRYGDWIARALLALVLG